MPFFLEGIAKMKEFNIDKIVHMYRMYNVQEGCCFYSYERRITILFCFYRIRNTQMYNEAINWAEGIEIMNGDQLFIKTNNNNCLWLSYKIKSSFYTFSLPLLFSLVIKSLISEWRHYLCECAVFVWRTFDAIIWHAIRDTD